DPYTLDSWIRTVPPPSEVCTIWRIVCWLNALFDLCGDTAQVPTQVGAAGWTIVAASVRATSRCMTLLVVHEIERLPLADCVSVRYQGCRARVVRAHVLPVGLGLETHRSVVVPDQLERLPRTHRCPVGDEGLGS